MTLRPPPSWLTWVVVTALIAVYIGERIVPDIELARIVLSGGGVLVVLLATLWRFIAWRRSSGEPRRAERLFLLTYAGCALSLIGFFLAGDGAAWLGIDFADNEKARRFDTAAAVLACIILAASLLPAIAAQWATPSGTRLHAATAAVDRLRRTQLATAGLTIALAGAFLFVTGYVASARDRTVDVGYFRTASPGTAARQIVESMSSPLRVLLFFPPANEVKDQVLGYFRALDVVAANMTIEQHDRLAAPDIAAEQNVTEDGTIVLIVADRSERLTVSTNLVEARGRLRRLDEDVQRALMRVAREERTVYFTVGHGELNDASATTPGESLRGANALRSLFGLLNYRVQELGVQSGLGNEVPADAAMVLVLGPDRPFLEPELQALDRYLARGGSALIALEPEGEFQLGPLRERLGVEFRNQVLADDAQHLRQRGNVSDRRLIVTDRFTSHASTSTLSRAGVGSGILLVGSGYLEPTPGSSPAAFIVRSMPTTFADADHDFEHDDGAEERKSYNVAAAVERAAERSVGAADSVQRMMRALVFADAELFSDIVVQSLGLNAALAADAMRWLGREEEIAGETTSEEDVPIVHTRAEDVAWFYSTIFGAPALVLGLGLLGVRRRRRRGTREPVERTA